MGVTEALFLGVVQGATEFLPISSSGHLFLLESIQPSVSEGFLESSPINTGFIVVVHVGTLIAALVYFRNDLIRYLKAFLTGSREGDGLYAQALVVAVLPVVAAGFLLFTLVGDVRFSTDFIALALIISALALSVTDFAARYGFVRDVSIFNRGFGVGVFQVLALIPGVSRSGITIAAGRALGFSRREATKFSFLLSIPTIFASLVLVVYDWFSSGFLGSASFLIAAGVAAFLVAMLVIHYFLRFVDQVGLQPFAAYQVLLGLVLLAFV